MNSHNLYWVNAFTQTPFQGNPAAVYLCKNGFPEEQWMQSLAKEFNLSETAFVVPQHSNQFALRWFTPTCEVDLCGHATLASAFALQLHQDFKKIVFSTRSGLLETEFADNGIQISLPSHALKNRPIDCDEGEKLLAAFGQDLVHLSESGFGLIAELTHDKHLVDWRADFSMINALPQASLSLTAPSRQPGIDFTSRVFAPKLGIDEDPVTGSAHCALGPYWANKLNTSQLRAYQASARGGYLDITIDHQRTKLTGRCSLIFKGEIHDQH